LFTSPTASYHKPTSPETGGEGSGFITRGKGVIIQPTIATKSWSESFQDKLKASQKRGTLYKSTLSEARSTLKESKEKLKNSNRAKVDTQRFLAKENHFLSNMKLQSS
jgi:hypothetical protein